MVMSCFYSVQKYLVEGNKNFRLNKRDEEIQKKKFFSKTWLICKIAAAVSVATRLRRRGGWALRLGGVEGTGLERSPLHCKECRPSTQETWLVEDEQESDAGGDTENLQYGNEWWNCMRGGWMYLWEPSSPVVGIRVDPIALTRHVWRRRIKNAVVVGRAKQAIDVMSDVRLTIMRGRKRRRKKLTISSFKTTRLYIK